MTETSESSDPRIDAIRGRFVIEETMRVLAAGEKVERDLWRDFVTLHNQGFTSGLDVGSSAPHIELPDQDGRDRTLPDLVGSEGLLLAFVRSADW
ncbi:MAG: hypothetical protein JRG86_17965 [Deltaproteobacteria bacterium]|jgi:hypothetical protein|nr:hypothetical protein [Deltaproteobacteria bacterium]MBW2500067.1 hypothetical protein [Deltaproteobacteria bacterium]